MRSYHLNEDLKTVKELANCPPGMFQKVGVYTWKVQRTSHHVVKVAWAKGEDQDQVREVMRRQEMSGFVGPTSYPWIERSSDVI